MELSEFEWQVICVWLLADRSLDYLYKRIQLTIKGHTDKMVYVPIALEEAQAIERLAQERK